MIPAIDRNLGYAIPPLRQVLPELVQILRKGKSARGPDDGDLVSIDGWCGFDDHGAAGIRIGLIDSRSFQDDGNASVGPFPGRRRRKLEQGLRSEEHTSEIQSRMRI